MLKRHRQILAGEERALNEECDALTVKQNRQTDVGPHERVQRCRVRKVVHELLRVHQEPLHTDKDEGDQPKAKLHQSSSLQRTHVVLRVTRSMHSY